MYFLFGGGERGAGRGMDGWVGVGRWVMALQYLKENYGLETEHDVTSRNDNAKRCQSETVAL